MGILCKVEDDELKKEWDIHYVDALVVRFREFNGHVGSDINGLYGFDGRYGVGQFL